MRGQTNHTKSFRGGSARGGGNVAGDRNTDGSRANRRQGQFSSPQIGGGIEPGGYAFYVYTGEFRDTPAGRRFFADEKSFLGRFECNVDAKKN